MIAQRVLRVAAGTLALGFVALRAVPFHGANIGRGVDSLDYLTSSRLRAVACVSRGTAPLRLSAVPEIAASRSARRRSRTARS